VGRLKLREAEGEVRSGWSQLHGSCLGLLWNVVLARSRCWISEVGWTWRSARNQGSGAQMRLSWLIRTKCWHRVELRCKMKHFAWRFAHASLRYFCDTWWLYCFTLRCPSIIPSGHKHCLTQMQSAALRYSPPQGGSARLYVYISRHNQLLFADKYLS
jgi:hypothetical protein